ncbi:MAG: SprT family zinc-dependent metalloprotease [Neisseriaceae bacterium]
MVAKDLGYLEVFGSNIPCFLKYSSKRRRDSLAISFDPQGNLQVYAGLAVTETFAKKILQENVFWIQKQLLKYQAIVGVRKPLRYLHSEPLFYLGNTYELKIVPKKLVSFHLKEDGIYVGERWLKRGSLQKKIENWYRSTAQGYFKARLTVLLEKATWTKITPNVRVRKMKGQWGNCSTDGTITLNIHLIKLVPHLIDYVILHELCHLKEANHGPRFYQLLCQVLPDWKECKQELQTQIYHLYGCY